MNWNSPRLSIVAFCAAALCIAAALIAVAVKTPGWEDTAKAGVALGAACTAVGASQMWRQRRNAGLPVAGGRPKV